MPGVNPTSLLIDELEQRVHDLIRQFDTMYKPEIVRINISSTFPMRAKCKECMGGPSYYFFTRKLVRWFDHKHYQVSSVNLRRQIKRMTDDWYFKSEPKYFHTIREFSFSIEDKHYLPTFHRSSGFQIGYGSNVVEFVSCECGATMWAFNQKSVKNRPEIAHRKGRSKYPERFEY